MWQQPGSYYALNLMDRPYQATTYAGAPSSSGSYVGVPVAAQTTYAYDDPSWNQGGLGNLTAVSQMNSLGAFLVTHLHYNAQGYNDQTQDPRGVLSTVSGFDCSGGSSNYTPTGSSASVAVYSQTIVKALGTSVAETSTALRDCNTGAVAQSTDPNGQSTSTWYDAGGNPLLVTYPDGGSTGYNYHGYATPLHITKTVAASPSPSLVSDTFEDGFGRTIHSYAAPGYSASPQGAAVDTGYDGMGRVVSVSNPYYSQSDATYGVTTSSYDGLNRKIGQTDSDGVSTQSWTYVGPTVQYKDENSHQWNRTYDEMGRLTQVVEPGTLTTSYTYDVLSNLLSVSQLGAGSGDTPRTRTFSYDSLSRLVCVSNTEISSPQQTQGTCPTAASSSYVSGTTQYTYDGNGNVVSKTMPAVNASSGTHTVGYNYDLLNRLLSKSYYDGSTPLSCYEYDSPSVANGIGRLSNAWTLRASAGSCGDTFSTGNGYLTARQIAAYDSLGRLWSETQCTNSGCRNSNPCQTSTGAYQSYTYDLAGGLVCAGNGIASTPGASNPPAFAYGYDASGRLASASSNSWSQYPSSLYSVTNYGPIGPLNWNLSGGNISVTQGFTNRLWVNSINATGQVP
jgi:YD repeat-containing protein